MDDQGNQNQNPYENTTYHYSYVSPYDQQPAAPTPPPAPEPPKKTKKKHPVLRTIALILVCALVGTGSGFGGAALFNYLNHRGGTGTTIYQNTTDPQPVDVSKVEGLTPMSLSEIDATYADACVCITVRSKVQQGYYTYDASGAGSGFILSEDGYIVTNYHVIEGAYEIMVTLNNGESYPASVVGYVELNDVAVLKLDGITGLKHVILGDSDDLVVGETVCTIGNALGTLSFSLTSGTVSATGRSITMSDGTVMNMIQTNCTINAGNSGGPLFDSYGRVCGITSAKYSNNGDTSNASIEGIGFAIPINDVATIITDYIEHGYVTGRPDMGITVSIIEDDVREMYGWPAGVLVREVNAGSCSEKAGLRRNDIITKLGDTDITGVQQMVSVKNKYRAGDTVDVEVWRAGETITLHLTFDEQTAADTNTATQVPSSGSNGSSGNSGNGYGNYPGYGYGGDGSEGDSDGYGYFDPWSWFFGR